MREHCPDDQAVNLELKAGQVALLHNWTIHRSGVNSSKDMARRAFSVNYMDGRTQLVRPDKFDEHRKGNAATGWAIFPRLYTEACVVNIAVSYRSPLFVNSGMG